MSTITFPVVTVTCYTKADGTPADPLKIVNTKYGDIMYFRALERYGYGDNTKYLRYDFVVYRDDNKKLFDRMRVMKIQNGSTLTVTGTLQPYRKEVNGGPYDTISIRVLAVDFAYGGKPDSVIKNNMSMKSIPMEIPREKKTIIIHEEDLQEDINLDEDDIFLK